MSSVLSVLAALWLPALSRAKHATQRSVCLSNVSQLNLTVHMYTDDHGNELRTMTNKEAIYASEKERVLPPTVSVCRWKTALGARKPEEISSSERGHAGSTAIEFIAPAAAGKMIHAQCRSPHRRAGGRKFAHCRVQCHAGGLQNLDGTQISVAVRITQLQCRSITGERRLNGNLCGSF